MRQHFRFPFASTAGMVIVLSVGCGHMADFPDEGSGATGNRPGTGGTGTGGTGTGGTGTGGTGTGGTGTGGTGGSGVTAGTGAEGGSVMGTMSCADAPTQQFDPKTMPGYTAPVPAEVETFIGVMSPEQKILQMSGVPVGSKDYRDIERSPDDPDLNIRGYRYRDAGHGVNLDAGQDNRADGDDYATNFPQASTRGASWDLDLEYRLGEAMGDETAASLNNMLLAPCMNIIRHPYWGRTQETYGEDSYHIGRMASAFTAGLQTYVTGCAKHFAANNVERNRSNQDALMDEQTLREIYGRHFEMVIQDAGVGCIMASYNKINGKKSTQNAHLLTTILRSPLDQGGMAYRGLVISDWWAMPGDQNIPETTSAIDLAGEAALAGLDIEVPWTLYYSQLTAAIAENPDVADAVDRSARRILEQKFRFNSALGNGTSSEPWSLKPPTTALNASSIATHQPHLDLAEEAVIKSAVLLKNGEAGAPVLPFAGAGSIAVVGLDLPFTLRDTSYPPTSPDRTNRMATEIPAGDRGSSRVNADPAQSVGPFAGIQQIGTPKGATVTSGNNITAAMGADRIVVVVGHTPGDEGEEYAIPSGGDRTTLNLPGDQNAQNAFVDQVLALDKPTVIIIQSGSYVNLPWLGHANKKQATIWAGHAGMRAGLAYAKLIFGDANFSGKFPMAWAPEAELIQFKTGELATNMGYFFGYREYDRRANAGEPVNLVFPFGHGLSYSTFTYSNLQIPCGDITKKGIMDVKVDIANTSAIPGEEVAFLFVMGPPYSGTGHRPVKELKSFAKVMVPANGMATATLPLRINDLRRWDGGADGRWVIDNGDYKILVGKSGAMDDLTLYGTFTIHD